MPDHLRDRPPRADDPRADDPRADDPRAAGRAAAGRRCASLDGTWELVHVEVDGVADDPDKLLERPADGWRHSTVPGPWQADPELTGRHGTVWYRRRITVTPDRADGAGVADDLTILRIGAANHDLQVHLDGCLVATHRGGYLPVEVDLTAHVSPGSDHVLLLRVHLPSYDPALEPGPTFDAILHGKQSWYGPSGGLWQSVTLERRPRHHVAAVRVLAADPATGVVTAHVELARPAPPATAAPAATQPTAAAQPTAAPETAATTVTVEVLDATGTVVATTTAAPAAPDPAVHLDVEVAVADPRAWSPDTPALYHLRATLISADGQPVDSCTTRFGFRTIAVRDGRLQLNGAPLEVRGVLDQDEWPGTGMTAPSRAAIEDRLRQAKAMGFNLVRCHVKVPDPRYLDVADELGMLVWCELPHWETLTADTLDEIDRTLAGVVARDGHHPSIVVWTVVNESWGVDVVTSADDRRFVRDTARRLRVLDPSRLVVDNSPCVPNFHLESDLDDVHLYRAHPARRTSWDATLDDVAAGADWTYSPHGDAVRRGDEPRLISEFGAWGLPAPPDDDHLDVLDGGDEWVGGAAGRAGMASRAQRYGLTGVFGSLSALVAATQQAQFDALEHQIGAIRRRPGLQGYVVTELTDVGWEANGLLDEHGTPRGFVDRLTARNATVVLVVEVARAAVWAGERAVVRVWAVNEGAVPIEGRVRWRSRPLQAEGMAADPVRVPPGVTELPPIHLEVGTPPVALVADVQVELVAGTPGTPGARAADGGGEVLASGSVDVAVHPRPGTATAPPSERVWSPDAELAERLAALGHSVTAIPHDAAVQVLRRLDATSMAAVRGGARVLVLADDEGALGPNVQDALRPRIVAAADDQDWVPTFGWLARRGPFTRFPGGPMLDASFERVIGSYVVTGVRSSAFAARAYGGSFVGWVHNVGASVLRLPLGAGVAILTTYELFEESPLRDPVATALTGSLLELAAGSV